MPLAHRVAAQNSDGSRRYSQAAAAQLVDRELQRLRPSIRAFEL